MLHRLRLATAADVPALNPLIALSARGLSAPFYTHEQIEAAIQFVFGVDSQLIADGTYYVVEADAPSPLRASDVTGRVGQAAHLERPILVGCGGWSRRRTLYGGDQMKSTDDPPLDPAVEAARIRAFFIHPDWARRGIARDILYACIDAARAAGFRSLELAATLPGVPLYERYGFESLELSQHELPNGVSLPILHMRRGI